MRTKKKFKNLYDYILQRRHEFIRSHGRDPTEIVLTHDAMDLLVKQSLFLLDYGIQFHSIAGMKIIIADKYDYSESIMFGIR